MKLLEKNNRTFFRFTTLLLLVGSGLFYLAVNHVIRNEIDEKLEVNRLRTIALLKQGQPMPQFGPIVEVQVSKESVVQEGSYSDTLIYDPVEQEGEPYRQLSSGVEVGGTVYEITNRTSLVEADDLLLAIGGCTLGLAALLFWGLVWLNRRSAKQLWQPFQQQLDALKHFSLAQNEPLALTSSGISEFEELKTALQKLTEKVRADYRNLKEFTENASHEIQTPLAIIRSKIEYFIENEPLTDKQLEQVAAVYEAANRLSRLNQNLLLLAKIENRQFMSVEAVSPEAVISEQLEMLEELTEAKKLTVKTEFPSHLTLDTNRTLVEMLVKNLIENAIRYSQPGDTIFIEMKEGRLVFCNPGSHAVENPYRLFERFHQEGNHRTSLGLGLAIVKKICEVNGWEIGYAFVDGHHRFSVSFAPTGISS